MPLAPNCQIMSWQKSQFASQLVVQKRIHKICEVEGRPMQRNRPDSRILIIFACGVRNPGFRIRRTAQEIRNPTNDWTQSNNNQTNEMETFLPLSL